MKKVAILLSLIVSVSAQTEVFLSTTPKNGSVLFFWNNPFDGNNTPYSSIYFGSDSSALSLIVDNEKKLPNTKLTNSNGRMVYEISVTNNEIRYAKARLTHENSGLVIESRVMPAMGFDTDSSKSLHIPYGGSAFIEPGVIQKDSDDFSISFWVKLDSIGDYMWLIGQRHENRNTSFRITLDQVGRYDFTSHTEPTMFSMSSNLRMIPKAWNQIICTRSAEDSEVKLYLNGEFDWKTKFGWESKGSVNDTIFIGSPPPVKPSQSYLNPYLGLIDEIAFFNKILTDEDVKELYRNGRPKFLEYSYLFSDLIGYYPLNEPVSDFIFDHSRYGHHGKRVKANRSNDVSTNSPPKFTINTNDYIYIAEDSTVQLLLTAEDKNEGDTLIYSANPNENLLTEFRSDTLYITPKLNWFGRTDCILTLTDTYDTVSTKIRVVVEARQDPPVAFFILKPSSLKDSVTISKNNITNIYDIKWSNSVDVDGDSVLYKIVLNDSLLAKQKERHYSFQYQTFLDLWNNQFQILPKMTQKLAIVASDGNYEVVIDGGGVDIYVNRYEYLSTESEGIPTEFALHENYPNPFNPTTTLRFDLPEVSSITLTIYNMLGQKVRTFDYQNTSAGYHSVTWNATNDYGDPVGAGVYLYQLQTKDFVKTRKMVLLK